MARQRTTHPECKFFRKALTYQAWSTGEGRVHQCLRDNFQKLTENCRKEELKLNIIQSRDVRLRPKLQKACTEEMVIYCKAVQPGEQLHLASLTFSDADGVWKVQPDKLEGDVRVRELARSVRFGLLASVHVALCGHCWMIS
jgi:hypothetical protein